MVKVARKGDKYFDTEGVLVFAFRYRNKTHYPLSSYSVGESMIQTQ
jgi:hypothetical protein